MPVWARYLITGAFIAVCFEVSLMSGKRSPEIYFIFLSAVALSSVLFNRGAGLFATVLSGTLAFYFFIDPPGSFAFENVNGAISILLFLVVGGLIATIIEAMGITSENLAIANGELESRQAVLTASLSRLEAVFDSVPDPIYLKDMEGRYSYLNAAAAALLDAPRDVAIGQRDRDFVTADQAKKMASADRTAMDRGSPVSIEEKRVVPGGGARWFFTTRSPWYEPTGQLAGVVAIARDIHERRIGESILRSSEEQKSLQLADLTHRVKNHLQSITALLHLSMRGRGEEIGLDILQSAERRIAVLARAYDRLAIGGMGGAVQAREYLNSLIQDIAAAIVGERPIAVQVDIAEMRVDADRAVTMGLIVNEALTNALKHAFPGDRVGTVVVRLRDEEKAAVLQIADDGVGLVDEKRPGTGHWLLTAMARQLQGSIRWTTGAPGTVVTVKFPKSAARL